MVSFRASRGLLFPKPVSWLELFFSVSYSKPALTLILIYFMKLFLLKKYFTQLWYTRYTTILWCCKLGTQHRPLFQEGFNSWYFFLTFWILPILTVFVVVLFTWMNACVYCVLLWWNISCQKSALLICKTTPVRHSSKFVPWSKRQ